MVARTVLHPTVQAAATLKEYGEVFGTLHLEALVEVLSAQTKAATEGDLTRAEAMLTAQTHTLDAIFNNLARRAINAEYMVDLDRYLKLALRAQSQCRPPGKLWRRSRTRRLSGMSGRPTSPTATSR